MFVRKRHEKGADCERPANIVVRKGGGRQDEPFAPQWSIWWPFAIKLPRHPCGHNRARCADWFVWFGRLHPANRHFGRITKFRSGKKRNLISARGEGGYPSVWRRRKRAVDRFDTVAVGAHDRNRAESACSPVDRTVRGRTRTKRRDGRGENVDGRRGPRRGRQAKTDCSCCRVHAWVDARKNKTKQSILVKKNSSVNRI